MARKKKHIEVENNDRWLVSYADFITLLFAFFVVMYSMSSVNEGKYRVLSDSVSSAFSESARSLKPIQIGELSRQNATPVLLQITQPISVMPLLIPQQEFIVTEEKLQQTSTQIEEIATAVEDSLASFIDDEEITLRSSPLWLEIEINSNILFTSANANPSTAAETVLRDLAEVVSERPNKIQVEGFTDNQPIQNSVYPSNWELSSARAAAVVRLFQRYGVEPTRMVSIGYGEFKPTVTNTTIAGRATNRRVVIVIMADTDGSDESDFQLMRERINN